MIQRRLDIPLDDRSYPVYEGLDMVSSFAPVCRRHGIGDSLVILTDRNVAALYLQPLVRNLLHHNIRSTTIILPPGEQQKSLRRANAIYTEMLEKRIPRSSAVVALGGGVIGDLAGFVAATYQRGIKLIQVPTTLLAQVDSSIGGKIGVNHPLGKNMIGAFYQPVFVWMDAAVLKTLPPREIVCGLGEVAKYGIIQDAKLFEFLETNVEKALLLEDEALLHVQERCAALKAEIVVRDEKESGIRRILNCGHTIGHGLESAGHYKLLKHGEAVLFGLMAESYMARELHLLDAAAYRRIAAFVRRVLTKTDLSSLSITDVLGAIGRDKKHIGKTLRFVLPVRIGKVKVVEQVSPALIRNVVKKLLKDWTSL